MIGKKRRKRYKVESQIPFPRALALCVIFIAIIGLSYVWVCSRCETLGFEIRQLEAHRNTLRQRAMSEQDRWSNLMSPASLERSLKRHGLVMNLPDERQIVRVHRPQYSKVITLASKQ